MGQKETSRNRAMQASEESGTGAVERETEAEPARGRGLQGREGRERQADGQWGGGPPLQHMRCNSEG